MGNHIDNHLHGFINIFKSVFDGIVADPAGRTEYQSGRPGAKSIEKTVWTQVGGTILIYGTREGYGPRSHGAKHVGMKLSGFYFPGVNGYHGIKLGLHLLRFLITR
jgi:hypothetical protein